jgi:hypothetical protein
MKEVAKPKVFKPLSAIRAVRIIQTIPTKPYALASSVGRPKGWDRPVGLS